MKREAVSLYCTGLSLNATGKRLGVSAQSVMRWVRDHAREHCPKPEPEGRAVVIELDEMWHYLKKSQNRSGSGSSWGLCFNGQLVDWECGDRDKATLPTSDRAAHALAHPADTAPTITPSYDVLLAVGQRYAGKDETHRDRARQRPAAALAGPLPAPLHRGLPLGRDGRGDHGAVRSSTTATAAELTLSVSRVKPS